MASLGGIKGSLTLQIGDASFVKDFTLPVDVNLDAFDKDAGTAKLTVDTEAFNASVAKLKAWYVAFPADLSNG